MADQTQLLYLEPDDEITTVVRRLRETDAARVVLVASGRSKATTSAVALRLLAQVAAEEGREIALVADPAARSLAAEAGIAAFASVANASAEGAVPPAPAPAPMAPIHVVRGEPEPAAPDVPASPMPSAAAPPPRSMDETQAVAVARPVTSAARSRPARTPARRRGVPVALLVAILALAVVGGAAGAVLLPSAEVDLRPQAVAIGPVSYQVRPEVQPSDAEPLQATAQGEATGSRTRRVAAQGVVTFINYSADDVLVPAGTPVSADGQVFFETTAAVSVPDSSFFGAGLADAPVVAREPGPAGNLPSETIEEVEDREVARALRAGGNPQNRLVFNAEPTAGGEEQPLTVVRRIDVNRVIAALTEDLLAQLQDRRAATPERAYPAAEPPAPDIDVPDDLVGNVSPGAFTFELTGTLRDRQPYVLREDAEAAAREELAADDAAIPAGSAIEPDSVEVRLRSVELDGEATVVSADVTARAIPQFEVEDLRTMIAARTAAEAMELLEPIGPATVKLWPFWVDRVPGMDWRVQITVRSVEPAE